MNFCVAIFLKNIYKLYFRYILNSIGYINFNADSNFLDDIPVEIQSRILIKEKSDYNFWTKKKFHLFFNVISKYV